MVSETSPTARALLALELLQGNPGITADRLADKLGVSERAARRYVGILREAGIPIDSVRGPYGGYRVGRGLRLPPLVFSAEEALGLVMAVLDGHHDADDPTQPVGSALGELVRALPEPVAAQADAVRRTTAPAPDRSAAVRTPASPQPWCRRAPTTGASGSATGRRPGTERDIDVEPWAVVVRHGRWYLLCRSVGSDATRAYPDFDRVRSVEELNDIFVPPDLPDPVSALEEHLGLGWEYDVEVLIDGPLDKVGRCIPRERSAGGPRGRADPAGRQHEQPHVVRRERPLSRRRTGSTLAPRCAKQWDASVAGCWLPAKNRDRIACATPCE